MKHGILFIILGLMLCGMPWVYGSRGWTWLPFWLGANMLLLGVAYTRNDTEVFGKQSGGTLSMVRVAFFMPWLLFTWGVWHLCRMLPEPAVQRINDKLSIGRRLLPHELPSGIDVILDLTSEFHEPAAVRNRVRYLSLPVLDAGAPKPSSLMTAIQSLGPEEHVFIHCAQGHGRTAIAAIALLLHRGETGNVADGLLFLQTVRPGVNLSPVQRRCLEQCEMTPQ